MNELDFINVILDKSGAKLLLDINNVYVNGHNYNYYPYEFIRGIKIVSAITILQDTIKK